MAVGLSRDLLSGRDDALHRTEIDVHQTGILALLDDPGDEVALAG